tara:strand:- start:82 stop:219 length:138 start_codon:yes stop_codon:yes gene_type:complete
MGVCGDMIRPHPHIYKEKEVKKWKKKAIEYAKQKLVKNGPRSAKL